MLPVFLFIASGSICTKLNIPLPCFYILSLNESLCYTCACIYMGELIAWQCIVVPRFTELEELDAVEIWGMVMECSHCLDVK